MAKRKKAKSWAEYDANQRQIKAEVGKYMAETEASIQRRPNDLGLRYNPRAVKALYDNKEAITPGVAAWYKEHKLPAVAKDGTYQERTDQEKQDDPEATTAIRSKVLDDINSQLMTPDQLKEQADIQKDPEAAQAAIQMLIAEQGNQKQSPLVDFINDLGAGYMWANYQATHPFTAAAIALNPKAEASGDIAKAWEQSSAEDFESLHPKQPGTGKDAITIGQAISSNERFTAPFGSADINAESPGEAIQGESLQWGDPNSDEMRKYFKDEEMGMSSSAALDTAQQSIGDGLQVALKSMKVALGATQLTTKASALSRVPGFSGRFSTAARNIRLANMLEASRPVAEGGVGETNALGALSDWLVKESGATGTTRITQRLKRMGAGDRADVAHLFASTNNRTDMDRLLRASWGDGVAIKELKTADPEKYMQFLVKHEKAKEIRNFGAEVIGLEKDDIGLAATKKAHPDELFEAGWKATLESDPEMTMRIVQSLAESNPALAREMQLAVQPELNVIGSLANVKLGGGGTRGFGGHVGAARMMEQNAVAGKIADGQFSHSNKSLPVVARFLDNPLGTAVAVLRWPMKEQPSGLVGTRGLSREGSADEINAYLEQPHILRSSEYKDLKTELANHWAAYSHLDATSSGAAQHIERVVVTKMADAYARKAAARRGLVEGTERHDNFVRAWSNDKVEGIYKVQEMRDEAKRKFIQQGYDIDQSSRTVVTAPQLAQHLDESVALLDLGVIEREMRKAIVDPTASWTKKASGKASEGIISTAEKGVMLNDAFQSVWRPLVLLRAAYPIRNTIEGYSRILGFSGFNAAFAATSEQLATTAGNTVRRVQRRTGSTGRAEEGLTAASTVLDKKAAHLAEAQANLDKQIAELKQARSVPSQYGRGSKFNHSSFVDTLRSQSIDGLDEVHPLSQLDGELTFSLDEHVQLLDDIAAARAEVDAAKGAVAGAEAKYDSTLGSRYAGTGTAQRPLADGSTVTTVNAFEGKQGEVAIGKVSNDDTWARITSSNASYREREFRNKVSIGNAPVYASDTDAYANAIHNVANRILKDSPTMQMRLDPTVTADDYVRWFYSESGTSQREASREFKRASKGMKKSEIEALKGFAPFNVDDANAVKQWFEYGRQNLYETFPDAAFRQRIIDGTVTPGAIKDYMTRMDTKKLPPIIGDRMVETHGIPNEGRSWWRTFTQKAFKTIGATPENVIVRQPYYTIKYNEYMDNVLSGLNKSELSDTTLAKLTTEAHRFALRNLRRDIYTIIRQKNLPGLVENVSPFWTAQINTATTWPRIMAQRPESLAGIGKAYVRMREGGFIDDEGYFNPFPWHQHSAGGIDVRIPFTNVLSIFAGQTNDQISDIPGSAIWGAFAPNPGPQFQMFASEAQKGTFGFKQLADIIPEGQREGFFTWANSLGPSTEALSLDRLMPGWGRTVWARIQGEGNGTYDSYAAMITNLEIAKADHGLRDYPKAEEIRESTDKLLMTLALGQFTMPGSPRASSPIYAMTLKAREYTEKYGFLEGTQKFLDTYGEEWRAAVTHGTKNQYGFGVEQSKESLNFLKSNQDLVREFGKSEDPDTVSLLMGAGDGEGHYDRAVRRLLQIDRTTNDGKPVLKNLTVEEILKQSQIQRGWTEFKQQYTTWKEAKITKWISKYGSTEAIPPEKWKALKDKRVSVQNGIASMNPDWAEELNSRPNKGRVALSALRKIVSDPSFASSTKGDGYWQRVADFIRVHDETATAIGHEKPKYQAQSPDQFFAWNAANNERKGYSFSADKQASYREKVMKEFNTPGTDRYKQWQLSKYQAAVEDLKRKNIRFADMHDRWFNGEAYDDNAF